MTAAVSTDMRITEEKSSPSREYYLDGRSPHNCASNMYIAYPDTGWQIDVSVAPKIILDSAYGQHHETITGVDLDKITLRIDLCHEGHDSAQAKVHLVFTQWRDQ
jgi:hypothetical protein